MAGTGNGPTWKLPDRATFQVSIKLNTRIVRQNVDGLTSMNKQTTYTLQPFKK